MIDQHALTGESAPAEKGVGDTRLRLDRAGGRQAVRPGRPARAPRRPSAKIGQILNDTAGYKLRSQSRGEGLADKAVIPTLALGALGLGTMGVGGATAIINSRLRHRHPHGRAARRCSPR